MNKIIHKVNDGKCKCCDGSGVQVRNDGLKVTCPGCGGAGYTGILY